ncbi:twin-arginine translocase subunit TatC, partial [Butyricicoccus sp. 1XD8-22]
MDPYGYNNLSPLDKKKRQESLKEVEEPVKESKELIEKQEVENKDLERTKEEDNQESWIEHITELRKQLIKSALVFIT